MKNLIKSLICCFVLAIAFAGAARGETFYAYLSSAQEVPTNTSTGTGYARIVVNESALTVSWTVVFNGLSSNQTGSHLHAPAAIGANSGVAINFPAIGGTSGTITGSGSITATQIAQIRAHQGYINIHSANFGGGEIRGQLGKKRPVDFDGDGRNDFSILRFPTTGTPNPITYWNLNSTTGVQNFVWGNALTDLPAPGDYDGDGKDDFALFRANAVGAQSEFWIVKSSDFTVRYFAWGRGGDVVCARDYDGDGITDPAVFRRGAAAGSPAFWYVRRSSNGTAQVEQFGTTGAGVNDIDVPVPGDYDGDGKFDLALYRAGTLTPSNNYIIKRSSDSVITYQPFGNFVTDYIVPGDYDGDGKYDLAVARTGAPATSPLVWWILQSSNSTTRTQTFGISSDVPTQGDYDGDARTDISIYRAGATGAQSNFWVFNSLSNVATVRGWGIGGDFAVNTFDAR